MITQFHVENFKALKDVTIELTPIHLLIGPNDSGKTSILQALAALSRSTDKDVRQIFLGRWGKTPFLWKGRNGGEIILTASLNHKNTQLIYEISILVVESDDLRLVDEKIIGKDGTPMFEKKYTTVQYKTKVQQMGNTDPLDPTFQVYSNLSGVALYRWYPQFLSLPVALDKNRHLSMETTGFGLAQYLDDILGMDRIQFAKLENRFQSIFPQVESLQLKPESAFRNPIDRPDLTPRLSEDDGKGIWIKFRGQEQAISASQVSEGMLIILAYLAVLFSPKPPRVLLIEEPENGIHPQRLREILKILRELVKEQNHTQIVMTTHSPDIVSEFKPEEVTLCSKNEEGAVITKRLSDIPDVTKYGDFFTLGEIWMNQGDQALMDSKAETAGVAP